MVRGLLIATLGQGTTVAKTLSPLLQVCFCGEGVKTGVEEEFHCSSGEIIEEGLPGGVGEGGSEEVVIVPLLD